MIGSVVRTALADAVSLRQGPRATELWRERIEAAAVAGADRVEERFYEADAEADAQQQS